MTRVYLAGPDVFLPDAAAWLERKKAICAGFHLVGVSPLDEFPGAPPDWADLPDWRRIALRNEAHIRSCAAIVANLTPFRGPSADVGTVYEIGFARGLGLKVFGYATVATSFLDRTLTAIGGGRQDADGSWRDPDGLLVEQFGLFDNLMIEAGITGSGGTLLRDDQNRWNDLTVFERCIEAAAAAIRAGQASIRRRVKGESSPSFTVKQGQYLAFIHTYTLLNGRPPAEAEMMRFFRVTPPSVHQMVLGLEKAGLISRQPGVPRSIAILLDRSALPELVPPRS